MADTPTPNPTPTAASTTAPTAAPPTPAPALPGSATGADGAAALPARPAWRALVSLPPALQRGVPFELRTTLGHPMETGFRADAMGRTVPRDLVTRFECRLDGVLVFSADLFPAMAANPHLALWLQVDGPATLTLDWTGDHGMAHRETRTLQPT